MPTAINSCPRPMKNFHANTIVKTIPTSTILVEDSDSQMEEIDILTGTDDLLPPSIKSNDYDSEGDIHFLEELPVNDSILLLKNKSSYLDHQDDPSFPRPPPKPSNVEFFVISAVINNIKMNVLTQEVILMFLQMLKMTITFPSYFSFEFFYRISSTLRFFLYLSPLGVNTPFLILASPFRASGISLG
nr:hypothetical protein [Tanacetum cinerariifolium]